MSEAPISVLYGDLVLRHNRMPVGYGPLATATHVGNAENRSCGDVVTAALSVDPQGHIHAAGFEGESCAICTAAASILCGLLPGLSKPDAESLLNLAQAAIERGETPEPGRIGELVHFVELKTVPARRKCALLPVGAFRTALSATRP